jgi:hypothetical protein
MSRPENGCGGQGQSKVRFLKLSGDGADGIHNWISALVMLKAWSTERRAQKNTVVRKHKINRGVMHAVDTVILIGTVGVDPEVRNTGSGTP